VKILYIAGPTRSGSTLLSNILGEIEGFFNGGELIDFWEKGMAGNGVCGCGAPIRACDIWAGVIHELHEAFGKEIDLAEMNQCRDKFAHSRSVPKLMLLPGAKRRIRSRAQMYLSKLAKLYRTIESVTGCHVIIDASKNVGYAYLLDMMPQAELHIIHLIRDPRATSYSWLQKKAGLGQLGAIENSLVWNSRNAVAELCRHQFQNYMRIHYEDFVAHPKETITEIMQLVDEKPGALPFVSKDKVELGVNHSIYGNPNRFNTGAFKLKLDERWKQMRTADRLKVTLMTWPLLLRYRYGLLSSYHKE